MLYGGQAMTFRNIFCTRGAAGTVVRIEESIAMPAKKAEKSRAASNSGSRGSSKVTKNHDTIRRWTEKRGGHPATVKGTPEGGEHAGLLRIDFPDYSGQRTLKEISWDDFFAKFDEERLAFLFQEKTAGGKESRFCKLIDGDTAARRRRGQGKK
jgi:hypothetical protein